MVIMTGQTRAGVLPKGLRVLLFDIIVYVTGNRLKLASCNGQFLYLNVWLSTRLMITVSITIVLRSITSNSKGFSGRPGHLFRQV